jgi:CRP-like cAMP-binding protein
MGYLTQRPASVNVTATMPSKVLRIDRKSLEILEDKHPEVHAKLIWIMGKDIADKLRSLNAAADDKDQAVSGFGMSTFASAA